MPLPKSSPVVFFGTLIVVASVGLSFVAVTGFGAPPQVVAQANVLQPAATPQIERAPAPLPIRERTEPKEPAPPPARESREPAPPLPPPDATDTEPPAPGADRGRDLRLRSPYADVNVDRERGRMWVRAPYTAVDVDRNGGRVRVRAPFVDLDIRW